MKHELYWHNCYKDSYDLIAPDSYAHPAKMSPALCFKILDHLKELGLLKDNDTILDPMAGTGLTAITAGAKGYRSITVELEEKFIGFENQNKEYAERRLYKPLDWTILQGDSRKLSDILSERGLVSLMSPPYSEALSGGGINKKGYSGNKHSPTDLVGQRTYSADTNGQTPGQIGNMKDKPITITSPPYQEAGDERRYGGLKDTSKVTGPHSVLPKILGQSTGQIGNLPDKPITVMSPPYDGDKRHHGDDENGIRAEKGLQVDYGITLGQIGDTQSESYLSAMKQVYSEIAKVSNVLAIVIKNPTRNKQLRRLDLDTIAILKECGWTIKCQHRALLFEELEQADLFQGVQKKIKGRMSFFKRLSWQQGQPVANWEDVIICSR